MSGEHFSGGSLPHTPETKLPLDQYMNVEKNIAYACTDVVLRNPKTGELFLGTRQTEPQLGPWFVGGRNVYGLGINENGALQVYQDLGIDIPAARFHAISQYSTDFPIAAPGREDHGRHTVNSVLLVDLNEEEIELLNSKVQGDELRDEYSSGGWYDPTEISDQDSDFPYLIKQFIRDLHGHDILYAALYDEALAENELRDVIAIEERKENEEKARIASLSLMFNISTEEATMLERISGSNTLYAIAWTKSCLDNEQLDNSGYYNLLERLIQEKRADYEIRKNLIKNGIPIPRFASDNGPTLRAMLKTALHIIDLNDNKNGKIFTKLKIFESLLRQSD